MGKLKKIPNTQNDSKSENCCQIIEKMYQVFPRSIWGGTTDD
jgi:hypothetical protein